MQNERIGYTSVITPVGVVLVAQTAKGVCSVMVGDTGAPLLAELVAGFPGARIEQDDIGLQDAAVAAINIARGYQNLDAVPLDLRGTAFQVGVWEALLMIPAGQTRTYSEIAAQIGRSSAYRAVANACGANPVALLVPCHRAVRTDGALGGYKWGIGVKQALLAAEATARAA